MRWREILGSGPAIAALASIVTVGLSEGVRLVIHQEEVQAQQTESVGNRNHQVYLERQKFQYEIIKTALSDHKNRIERANALSFFLEIELLEGLNKEKLQKWAKPEKIISITSDLRQQFDAVVDEGLRKYGTELELFLKKMASKATGAEGKYSSKEVQEYYVTTEKELQFLLDRAILLDQRGECFPSQKFDKEMEKLAADIDSTADAVRMMGLPYDDEGGITKGNTDLKLRNKQLSNGSCSVILLRVVLENHKLLRLIHEENDSLPEIVVEIAGDTMRQSLRLAIKGVTLSE